MGVLQTDMNSINVISVLLLYDNLEVYFADILSHVFKTFTYRPHDGSTEPVNTKAERSM